MEGPKNQYEATFLKLYDASADALLRYCYYKTHDRDLAKDLVQESFLRTWRAIAAGQEIPNPQAFLYRTAGNLVIDHYRRKKSLSLDALADDGFDPLGEGAAEVEALALAREARAALDTLEEPYKETMQLRYISGLSITEIAEIQEESENAISVRIHRALEKLRTTLKSL
jgi:RNA polymerase sigma-70 factor (ECF subfamily)